MPYREKDNWLHQLYTKGEGEGWRGEKGRHVSLFQKNGVVPLALLFITVVGVNTLPTASILIPLLRLRLRYAVSQGTT